MWRCHHTACQDGSPAPARPALALAMGKRALSLGRAPSVRGAKGSLPAATADQAAASFEMEMSQTGFSAHYSQVRLPGRLSASGKVKGSSRS